MYVVNPASLHRFVGYIEEMAVNTYHELIEKTNTPGTKLNKAWADMPAPEIAVGYWQLPKDSKWVDVLGMLLADEAHHRDINHTFANMDGDAPNPFIIEHVAAVSKGNRDIRIKKGEKEKHYN